MVKENLLDIGEATAIALALEKQYSILVIDEYKGRKVAKALDIKITGTLGILLKAKSKGFISNVKPCLEKLEQNNFRLDKDLINQVLRQCGEA